MKASTCPSPEQLARVVFGGATPDERDLVARHASGCLECREEIESLQRLQPPEEWRVPEGRTETMPEKLWQAIAQARSSLGLRLRVRFSEAVEGAVHAGHSLMDRSLPDLTTLGAPVEG